MFHGRVLRVWLLKRSKEKTICVSQVKCEHMIWMVTVDRTWGILRNSQRNRSVLTMCKPNVQKHRLHVFFLFCFGDNNTKQRIFKWLTNHWVAFYNNGVAVQFWYCDIREIFRVAFMAKVSLYHVTKFSLLLVVYTSVIFTTQKSVDSRHFYP